MAKGAATAIACLLFSACAGTSWRSTAAHNTPAAWEFNSKMEGWLAFRDGWMRLRAPKGFEWDDVMQSYRSTLR
jgi:hypothetical protein